MGILNLFSKNEPPRLDRLPEGTFTIDSEGRIVTSTIPQWFPAGQVEEVARRVIAAFRQAREARQPLSELVVHYASLKITARELRGGALVFLSATQIEPQPQPPKP
jgi:hypothetical protein